MSRRNRERLKRAIDAAKPPEPTPPEPEIVVVATAAPDATVTVELVPPEPPAEPVRRLAPIPAERGSDAYWLAIWDGQDFSLMESACPHCGRLWAERKYQAVDRHYLHSCPTCGVILELPDRSYRILRAPLTPPCAPIEPTESWGLTDWRKDAKKLASRR